MKWWKVNEMFIDKDILEGEKRAAVLRTALSIQLDRLHQQLDELEQQLGEGTNDVYWT